MLHPDEFDDANVADQLRARPWLQVDYLDTTYRAFPIAPTLNCGACGDPFGRRPTATVRLTGTINTSSGSYDLAEVPPAVIHEECVDDSMEVLSA